MKKILKILFLIIMQAFVGSLIHAQERGSDYLSGPEEVRQHIDFYVNYAKEVLGVRNEDKISFAHRDRINLTKAKDFKKIGVDILSVMGISIFDNYQKAALLSPMIVEGVVVKNGADKNYGYLVKINEVLFDDLGFCLDTVKVKFRFGDVVNNHHLPGDKVVLFLSPLSLRVMSMVRLLRDDSKYDEEKISNYVRQIFNVPFSEINEFAKIIKDLEIIDGFIFDEGKNIGLKTDVLKQIRSMLEINNKEDFYKIHK